MNRALESYFCQAVEYNYEKALQAILTKVENPSAVVNKEYNIQVGPPHRICTRIHTICKVHLLN